MRLSCNDECTGAARNQPAQDPFSRGPFSHRAHSVWLGFVWEVLIHNLGQGQVINKMLGILPKVQADTEEKEFIDDLQIKLEIEAQRAKTIVKVMVYKNHG